MAAAVAVTAGTAIIGGIFGAMGAQKEGEAKEAAARTNAAIAGYNRDVALRNKGIVLSQTNADAIDANKELTRNLSTIRAAYGANGLALEGSPLDVINDTAQEKSLDVAKIRYKGDVQAAGYQDEANNYGMKQKLHQDEATYAPQIAAISATTQFLGGVNKAASAFAPRYSGA